MWNHYPWSYPTLELHMSRRTTITGVAIAVVLVAIVLFLIVTYSADSTSLCEIGFTRQGNSCVPTAG